MDCSLPGSAIHGILQARVLEWGAIAFSIGDSYSECWALFFSPHSISGFLGLAVVKNMPANAGDAGDLSLIPGSGRPPGEGNGNPLQYSCLENFMDRGAWWVPVHGVPNSWTWLSMHAHSILLGNIFKLNTISSHYKPTLVVEGGDSRMHLKIMIWLVRQRASELVILYQIKWLIDLNYMTKCINENTRWKNRKWNCIYVLISLLKKYIEIREMKLTTNELSIMGHAKTVCYKYLCTYLISLPWGPALNFCTYFSTGAFCSRPPTQKINRCWIIGVPDLV